MDEKYYNMYNETEIDLIDLMFFFLRQWKTFLLAVLLGLILGAGIYMLKKPADTVGLSSAEMMEITAEEIDPAVLQKMEQAARYRQLYDQQLEYEQNSIIMQMDAGEVYTGGLEYYLSADDNNTWKLSELYQNLLNDSKLFEDICAGLPFGMKEQYLREILSCTAEQMDNSLSGIGYEDLGLAIRNNNAVVLTYNVSYTDESGCSKILGIVKNYINEMDQKFHEKYGDYEFENIGEFTSVATNQDYWDRQKSCIDTVNSYLNNILTLEKEFSGDNLNYYKAVYLKEEMADGQEAEPLAGNETEETSDNLFKWLLIGVLLLCVCWGGYYLMKYLMDHRVKTSDELQTGYGLQILGRLRVEGRQQRGINGLITRMENKRKGSPDGLDYVITAVKALDFRDLLICADRSDQRIKSLVDELQRGCSGLQVGNMLHVDAETLEQAKKAAGIILLVFVKHTDLRAVGRDLEICRIQKIPVVGVIAAEER